MKPIAETTRPVQFSLLGLLIFMTLVGAMAANWRSTMQAGYVANLGFFWLMFPAILCLWFIMGQWLQGWLQRTAAWWNRPLEVACLVLAIATIGSCLLVRWRWNYGFIRGPWPLPAPYPDHLLQAVHTWFDRRYPAEAGAFKLHGEVGLVSCLVNTICHTLAALWGLMLGVVLRVNYDKLIVVTQLVWTAWGRLLNAMQKRPAHKVPMPQQRAK